MAFAFLRRRRYWVVVAGIACCITINLSCHGCCCRQVREWGDDEVVVSGAGTGEGNREFSILLSVKNITGVSEGRYEIRPPADWSRLPRVGSPDDVLDVTLKTPLDLKDARDVGRWGPWNLRVCEVPVGSSSGSVKALFEGKTTDGPDLNDFARLGATVLRAPDRSYRVVMWGEDSAEDRWLRLGTVPIGQGTQSPLRKPVEFILLVFAFLVDLVAVPLIVAYVLVGSLCGWIHVDS
jgi:hypothetical protein